MYQYYAALDGLSGFLFLHSVCYSYFIDLCYFSGSYRFLVPMYK